jgi:serine/threonine-protein kinase
MVLRAFHRKLHRPVAIKVLNVEALSGPEVRRFLDEARIGALFDDKHLVKVFDVDATDRGYVYFVMEVLEGLSLDAVLAREDVPASTVVEWCAEVAGVLGRAHDRGFVHRDVKPSNIFIMQGAPRYAKLLDFGIAKFVGNESVTASAVIGTPRFMSPEQLRAGRIDGRADIFSLGVVLYRALTGEYPFRDMPGIGYLGAVVSETPVSLFDRRPDLPRRLIRGVMKCLEKDPDDRFSNAREVEEMLRECVPPLREYEQDSSSFSGKAGGSLARLVAEHSAAGLGAKTKLDADTPTADRAAEATERTQTAEPEQRARRLFLWSGLGAIVIAGIVAVGVPKLRASSAAPAASTASLDAVQAPKMLPPVRSTATAVDPRPVGDEAESSRVKSSDKAAGDRVPAATASASPRPTARAPAAPGVTAATRPSTVEANKDSDGNPRQL